MRGPWRSNLRGREGISINFSETKGAPRAQSTRSPGGFVAGEEVGVPFGFFPISRKCGEGFIAAAAAAAAPEPARRR
jgi:hypothetical protein